MSPDQGTQIGRLIDNRGAVLTAFSQVEWMLGKIIVEASAFPEYADLDLSFSQDAEKRAARVRQVLSVWGPFSPYASDLEAAVGDVMGFAELRSFSAHGVLISTWSPTGELHLRFRMFRMFKGSELRDGTLDLSLKQYTEATTGLMTSTKAFLAVARRIWTDLGMKSFEPT